MVIQLVNLQAGKVRVGAPCPLWGRRLVTGERATSNRLFGGNSFPQTRLKSASGTQLLQVQYAVGSSLKSWNSMRIIGLPRQPPFLLSKVKIDRRVTMDAGTGRVVVRSHVSISATQLHSPLSLSLSSTSPSTRTPGQNTTLTYSIYLHSANDSTYAARAKSPSPLTLQLALHPQPAPPSKPLRPPYLLSLHRPPP